MEVKIQDFYLKFWSIDESKIDPNNYEMRQYKTDIMSDAHVRSLHVFPNPHLSASPTSTSQIARYLFHSSIPNLHLLDLHLNLTMADRHRRNPITTFLSNLQTHSPNSTQMLGILTLIITVSILLILAGITLTTTVLGLIVFSPIIIISSPVWIPLTICTILTVGSVLGLCGTGLGMVVGGSWIYKYFKGMNPPGAGRVDYARSRIVDTAGHVKDYAKVYGGYLHSKVKDAAPGA